MSRIEQTAPQRSLPLLLLLVCNVLVCAGIACAQVLGASCADCISIGWVFPVVASFCYGGLALVEYYYPRLWILPGAVLASMVGIHAGLILLSLKAHMSCAACLLSASLALAAVIVRWSRLSVEILVAALLTPVVAAMSLQLFSSAEWIYLQDRPDRGKVKLLVYEKEGCPACHQFRTEVDPAVRRWGGDRVSLHYIPASQAPPFVHSLPTIVILHPTGYFVQEGSPDLNSFVSTLGNIVAQAHE